MLNCFRATTELASQYKKTQESSQSKKYGILFCKEELNWKRSRTFNSKVMFKTRVVLFTYHQAHDKQMVENRKMKNCFFQAKTYHK